MLQHPMGNNVLVEVIEDYAGVSRNNENESQKKGKMIAFNIERYHLTASAALDLSTVFMDYKSAELTRLCDQQATVHWEELANEGQTFDHEGKKYAFVAWWRLTGKEEEK